MPPGRGSRAGRESGAGGADVTGFHSAPLRAAGAIEIFSEEVFRGPVEMTLSRVIFRNMTSEDRADEAQARTGRAGDEPGGEDRAGGDRVGGDRGGGDRAGGD